MAKIMIAEDDLLMADMLEDVLVGGGYEVCGIARTVDEAVKLGKRHQPDLAILDIRLAGGGRYGYPPAAEERPPHGRSLCVGSRRPNGPDKGEWRRPDNKAVPPTRRSSRGQDRRADRPNGRGIGTVPSKILFAERIAREPGPTTIRF